MEKYKFTPLEEEMFALLHSLKEQDNDKNVVFAVALMCMDSEEVQRNVIDYIKTHQGSTSLEDVCRFLNTMFEPLEVSENEEERNDVSA